MSVIYCIVHCLLYACDVLLYGIVGLSDSENSVIAILDIHDYEYDTIIVDKLVYRMRGTFGGH